MQTELIYLTQMQQLTCEAFVQDLVYDCERLMVILDRTVFYPQGGGQPWDTGIIKNQDGEFCVQEVRFVEGVVRHCGVFQKGSFRLGDGVACQVDAARRLLNTRLHSAGHIVDMALKELGKDWAATKGYHFPQGPYVEYATLDLMCDEHLQQDLEQKCNDIIQRGILTRLIFTDGEQVHGKPARVVRYGDFEIGCGGTHCENLKEVGLIRIKKIKQNKDVMRVSYLVEP